MPDELARFQRERLQRAILARAARLRDLADRVERYAADVDSVPRPGIPSYATIASSVQHAVLWGVANLGLDNLTSDAYDADRAARS